MIKSDKITLRLVNYEDSQFLYDLHSAKEYMKYFGQPWESQDFAITIIKNSIALLLEGKEFFFIILDNKTTQKIGYIRAYFHDVWKIDFACSSEHKGNGHVSNALNLVLEYLSENRVTQIYATVNSFENFGALKILYNHGFQDYEPIVSGITEVEKGLIESPSLGVKMKWDKFNPDNVVNLKLQKLSDQFYTLANAQEDIGNFEKAFDFFDKAIQYNPNNSLAYADKGYTLMKYSKEPYYLMQANQFYTKAIFLNSKIPQVYHNRALCKYGVTNYFGASLDLYQNIKLSNNSASHFLLGVCYFELGNNEMALKNLKIAQDLGNPNVDKVISKYLPS